MPGGDNMSGPRDFLKKAEHARRQGGGTDLGNYRVPAPIPMGTSDPEPRARSRGWVWRWYQCDGGETPWRRKNTDGEPDSIAGSIFKCLTWNDFNDFRNGGDSVFPADVYER